MQRHLLIVRKRAGTVQQILRKPYLVNIAFQNYISGSHQLCLLLHELPIRSVLIRHPLSVLPHLLRRILSIAHTRLKDLGHAGCLSDHIAEEKHLISGNEHVGTAIARIRCSVQQRSHLVAFAQLDRLGIVRRERTRSYRLFIYRVHLLFHSILPN